MDGPFIYLRPQRMPHPRKNEVVLQSHDQVGLPNAAREMEGLVLERIEATCQANCRRQWCLVAHLRDVVVQNDGAHAVPCSDYSRFPLRRMLNRHHCGMYIT